MKTGKYLYWLIGAALAIKLILFLYISFICSSSILENDSFGYLNDAKAWVHYLSFPSEGFRHSLYRTPGYSLFLAVFLLEFNLPYLGIILLQYVLIVLTAFVVKFNVATESQPTEFTKVAVNVPGAVWDTVFQTYVYAYRKIATSVALVLTALVVKFNVATESQPTEFTKVAVKVPGAAWDTVFQTYGYADGQIATFVVLVVSAFAAKFNVGIESQPV